MQNMKVLFKTLGLFAAVLLVIGACCINVRAETYLPDGTKVKSLSEGTPWSATIRYNNEGGVVMTTTSENICGYHVTVDPVARVEMDVLEMLDAKHLEIIEVNLVRFTDEEPWNELEPDVQSLYFVVNPWENHGEVQITWRTPGVDTNLAQGFRQTGPRCCFSLSVNNITGYLYSPAFGGEGVARKHIGFSDGILVVDEYLTGRFEAIIQKY